jgi:hypothetical protein
MGQVCLVCGYTVASLLLSCFPARTKEIRSKNRGVKVFCPGLGAGVALCALGHVSGADEATGFVGESVVGISFLSGICFLGAASFCSQNPSDLS